MVKSIFYGDIVKFVKCIKNSFIGFPSKEGKIYKVLNETSYCYYLHHPTERGEMKNRFIDLDFNEKIAEILYGCAKNLTSD